ncbi:MAG: glycosyltransferase family 4 protein [Anaerolineales bacterium]|nr:glycosyltransferase family 4 protein [Anaerolineales bacterium]
MNHSPDPILFLDHAPGIGGAERSLLLILRYLNTNQWRTILGCVDGELYRQAHSLNIRAEFVDFPPPRGSRNPVGAIATGAQSIATLAKNAGARLIVGNTVRASLYAALAARRAGIPFIWYMRDFWLSEAQPEHLWLDRMGKWLLCSLAAQVITNSRATATHLPCQRKVTTVLNGIEVGSMAALPDPGSVKRQFEIPEDRLLVGMAGRLRKWKGQDTFLKVAKEALLRNDRLHFVVIGGDPFHMGRDYAAELASMVTALDISDHVTFTGHLEDVRPALAALDIFVHPGNPEPFGLVNLEAMALSKPVVAFAHGALPEIVVPGETGVLVPPRDIRGMASAIIRMAANPLERSRLGEGGRRRVEAGFDIKRTVVELENIFQAQVTP